MSTLAVKSGVIRHFWDRARRSAMVYGSLATAVRVGANILLLPLILKLLPPPELAVWYVFLALGGIANLADFGFGSAMSRVYSFLWAGAPDFETEGLGPPPENHEPNRARIRQFHSAARTVYIRVAWVAFALLVVVGTLCLFRPMRELSNTAAGWAAWGGFILSITFNLGSNHWILACQGINRMQALQASQLFSGLAYVGTAAVLLVAGFGLFAMVVATAVRTIVARQMCRRTYLEAVPDEPVAHEADVRSMVKRIWPNARKFGMMSLGGYLTVHANVLICSHFLGSEVTASYGLTMQLANFITGFSALWLVVKWPQLTMLRTQGRTEEMGTLFARRLALVMISFAAMAACLLLFGNLLLDWKGTQTRFLPNIYLFILLLNLLQQQFYTQFGMLVFTENVVPFFKLSLFSGLAVAAVAFLLVPSWGLPGLVAAPLIVTGSSCLWYVTWRGFQGQPLTIRQFARAALLGHV